MFHGGGRSAEDSELPGSLEQQLRLPRGREETQMSGLGLNGAVM